MLQDDIATNTVKYHYIWQDISFLIFSVFQIPGKLFEGIIFRYNASAYSSTSGTDFHAGKIFSNPKHFLDVYHLRKTSRIAWIPAFLRLKLINLWLGVKQFKKTILI